MITRIKQLVNTIDKRDVKIHLLEVELLHLKERLAWFERQVFGKKSERFIDEFPCETPELPGLIINDSQKPKIDLEIIPEHKRKKKSKGKSAKQSWCKQVGQSNLGKV